MKRLWILGLIVLVLITVAANPTPTPAPLCPAQITATAAAQTPQAFNLWDWDIEDWVRSSEWEFSTAIPTLTVTPSPTVEFDDVNRAIPWDVSVERYQPQPGEWYWKLYRVWHYGDYVLMPSEPEWMDDGNDMRHHVFVDAWESEDATRIYGAEVQATVFVEDQITNERRYLGEVFAVVDKPLYEPGTNMPIWGWQVLNVRMLGHPSDTIIGMTTAAKENWPPPVPGQSDWGHHSYGGVFVLTQAEGIPSPTPTDRPTPLPTSTPTPTAIATPTSTAMPTNTPTATEVPSATPTEAPSVTPEPIPTPVDELVTMLNELYDRFPVLFHMIYDVVEEVLEVTKD